GSINPHNNYDFLRLVKVYKDGYIASAKYISIFDADIVKLIGGSNLLDILIPLNTAEAPPILSSIIRASANPASTTSVDFTVTFSEDVTGVDIASSINDFTLTTSGVSGAAVRGASGSGSVYTITVDTGSGNGTIRLDVPVSATITDLAGNPLSGLPFTSSGESYTIQKAISFEYTIFLPLILR
ncbi:MAG: Ig-like domain-containing protein, partial [Chloroflexi bacterium]|nr:Ig-like domain-containing protein [Chloroflexota bacterium]